PSGEIGEQARARTQQINGAREPVALAGGPLGPPEAAALEFGADEGQQLVDRKRVQILLIEPFEFGAVEDSVGAADSREREACDQIGTAQHLRIVPWRPAEQRQEIAKCLGQKALFAVQADADGAVPLGEPLAVGTEDQGNVGEYGKRRAERAIDQDLL